VQMKAIRRLGGGKIRLDDGIAGSKHEKGLSESNPNRRGAVGKRGGIVLKLLGGSALSPIKGEEGSTV